MPRLDALFVERSPALPAVRARSAYGVTSLFIGVSGTACTLLLDTVPGQCNRHADCQALNANYVCASDHVCVELATDERPLQQRDGAQCARDVDCAESAGLALCRNGYCEPLNDAEAGCVSIGWGTTSTGDQSDVLAIGMLVQGDELASNDSRRRISGAVGTAINELNRQREALGITALPALVGVACDEARPEALDYLLGGLRVRLIVGPTESSHVEAVLERTGQQALLVAPFADAPDLAPSPVDPGGYLLGCKPNRTHLQASMLDAVSEARAQIAALGVTGMETIWAALAVSSDAATQSFARGFNDGDLSSAETRRVTYTVEPRGRGLVNALQGLEPRPNLVIAASAEDAWQDNIAAFDAATYGTSRFYPYYLLGEKTAAVSRATLSDQATADGFPLQYLRFLGLDYHRNAQSALAYQEFANAFYAETKSVPEPGLEYAYDCTYVAVYATIAAAQRLLAPAQDMPPAAVLGALGALQRGGAALPARALDVPAVVASLSSSHGAEGSVDLLGASGTLDFEHVAPRELSDISPLRQYWAAAAADTELYCIDSVGKTYCDTGIVFPSAGGPPRKAANPCTCLRGH